MCGQAEVGPQAIQPCPDAEKAEHDVWVLMQRIAQQDATIALLEAVRAAGDAVYSGLLSGETNSAKPHTFADVPIGDMAPCLEWMCGGCGALNEKPLTFMHRRGCRFEPLAAYREAAARLDRGTVGT